jgi:hypothetical protein
VRTAIRLLMTLTVPSAAQLAGWLATALHASGWLVARGVDKSGPVRPSAPAAPAGAAQPLLMVVDYAER